MLVLEDMGAGGAVGDQVAGCDIETARAAVVELARLHAPRWDDASLYEHEFLQRRSGPEDGVQLAALWEMLLPGFDGDLRSRSFWAECFESLRHLGHGSQAGSTAALVR